MNRVHGLGFFFGAARFAGELVGATVELPGADAPGLATGNANVADGKAEPAGDAVEGVPLGDGEGVGVGLGVGEDGMIFCQRYNGTVAPPISLTNSSQRA